MDDIKTINNILEDMNLPTQNKGVLPCLGYRVTDQITDGCTLLFEIPTSGRKQSLLHYLKTSPRLPLNQRIDLCYQLARSVSTVHSISNYGLVHKHIRPMNVLLVGDDSKKQLFLTDWTSMRYADDMSTNNIDDNWAENSTNIQSAERMR